MKRKLNWIKESKPLYHIPFEFHPEYTRTFSLTQAVSHVDFRKSIMPPVVDQGEEGSCTFNAWAYLLGSLQIKSEMSKLSSPLEFDPSKFEPFSRQFGYYGERYLMGTVNEDSGATLSVGLQASQTFGCCREVTWPYSSPMTEKPSDLAFKEAASHKPIMGYKLNNTSLLQLKSCLLAGYPFVFGIDVYDSFMNVGKDGIVPLPNPEKESLLGGHALCCQGFDDHLNGGSFIVPNSWGYSWGDKGFCYIPYSFLMNPSLASDFLTARG
jgi:C1A family cysteine protease